MKRTALLVSFLVFISIINPFNDLFAQNVGIGIANPTRAKLELNGAVGATSAIFGGESSGISLQQNWPGVGFNNYYNGENKYIANGFAAKQLLDPGTGSMYIDMYPNGAANGGVFSYTRALEINNSGNIGIRTNPHNASLYVFKGVNFDGSAVFAGTTNYSHFDYSSNEDVYIRGGLASSKVIINDIPGGKIILGDGSCKVGLNNGVPAYPLEIRQVSGTGILLVEPVNSFNNWELRDVQPCCNAGASTELMLLYNGQYKGTFTDYSGYITFSDRRLKTGIRAMPPVLDKVMQLQPSQYEMKGETPGLEKSIGFIAQDVKKIFPDLVTVTSNTRTGYPGIDDLYGINYSGFGVLAIKALQEQQVKIKMMQQKNAELARRIKAAEELIRQQ